MGTIPAEVWSKAFKGVPRRPVKPVLGTVAAVLGKDQATLVSTDLENANVQSPRLVEGRWPNTDQVFPKGKPRFTINVDAKLLIDLLQVAMAFSSQDHNNKVTMEFHDRNQPFAIRTKSDDGQEFSGLIVPLANPPGSPAAARAQASAGCLIRRPGASRVAPHAHGIHVSGGGYWPKSGLLRVSTD